MLTPERIAELRKIESAMTRVPWRATEAGYIQQTEHVTRDVWTIPHRDADLSGIAAARNALPELLDEIDRLRSRNQKLDTAIRTITGRLKGCLCDNCTDDAEQLAAEAVEEFGELRAALQPFAEAARF